MDGNQIAINGIPFHLGESVGQGGQGTVYHALTAEGSNECRLVIKLFSPKDNPNDQSRSLRCERLSQYLATRFHQAAYASIFFDPQANATVMLKAAADSKPLRDILYEWDTEENLSDAERLNRSIRIISAMLIALHNFHTVQNPDGTQGILHMDISPGNVLCSESLGQYSVFFLDFNCSMAIGETVPPRMPSTPGFSDPTLMPGDKLTAAADLYSVGALLLRLVAGKRVLFFNTMPELPGEDNMAVMDSIEDLDLPVGVRFALGNILIKATTREPDQFYTSAEEMLHDVRHLKDVVENKGISREVLYHYSKAMLERHCNYEIDRDLLPELEKFEFNGKNKHRLLIGEGGTGKTTMLFTQWADLLTQYSYAPTNTALPIYVPLHGFKGSTATPYYIQDYILENYFKYHLNKQTDQYMRTELRNLLKNGNYCLLLDGINEAINGSELGEEIHILDESGSHIYIASRTIPSDSYEWLSDYSKIELGGISVRQLRQTIGEAVYLSLSPMMQRVLRYPMFLKTYSSANTTSTDCTPADILLENVDRMTKLPGRLGTSSIQLKTRKLAAKCLPLLAAHISTIQFSYSRAKDVILKDIEQTAEQLFDEVAACVNQRVIPSILDALLDMGLLKCDNTTYFFAHQHYKDLFYAQYIALSLTDGVVPDELYTRKLPQETIGFLGNLLGENRFRNTAHNGACSKTEKLLQSFFAYKRGVKVRLAVANLVEVLKIARENSLSDICFDNLDLSLVNFEGCCLDGASFKNAIISECAFAPLGHLSFLSKFEPIPNSNMVVSYCPAGDFSKYDSSKREYKLLVWDFIQGILVKTIPTKFLARGLSISMDGKFASVFDNFSEYTYDLTSGNFLDQKDLSTEVKLASKRFQRTFSEYKQILSQNNVKQESVIELCVSPDEAYLLCLTRWNELCVYSIPSGDCVQHFLIGTQQAHKSNFVSTAFMGENKIGRHIPFTSAAVLNLDTQNVDSLLYAHWGEYARFDGPFYLLGGKECVLYVIPAEDGTDIELSNGYEYIPQWVSSIDYFGDGWMCYHFAQAKFCPEHGKLVVVTAYEDLIVCDIRTKGWRCLSNDYGATIDTEIWCRDYPWKTPEPYNCCVVQDRILAVGKDYKLRVWDIDGNCVYSEETVGLFSETKSNRIVPIPNSSYCALIRPINKEEDALLYEKSYRIMRIWDIQKNALVANEGNESTLCTSKTVQSQSGSNLIDSFLNHTFSIKDFAFDASRYSICSEKILWFSPYSDFAFYGSLWLFSEEDATIEFIYSEDGVLAYARNAYCVEAYVVFAHCWAGKVSYAIYEKQTAKLCCKVSLEEERNNVVDFKLSENGKFLSVCLRDGTVHIFDARIGSLIYTWGAITAASVCGADFSQTDISPELKSVLKSNGAKID